ncbi:MAG: hypothetical protein J5826_04495 [Bacteroidales bacterium]|nr:hypothetical protein [Bacteroidales bacterium]
MNTNKFSFSRFANFFKWYYSVSIKLTIKLTAIIGIASFILVLSTCWYQIPKDNGIYQAIFYVATFFISYMMFADFKKPTIRKQILLIPAKNIEKGITILLITIIRILLFLGALFVVDLLRASLQSQQAQGFNMVINNFGDTPYIIFTSTLITFFIMGFSGGFSSKILQLFFVLMMLIVNSKFIIWLYNSSIKGIIEPCPLSGSPLWIIISGLICMIICTIFLIKQLELNKTYINDKKVLLFKSK